MLIKRFTSGIGIFYLVFIVLLIALFILRNTVGLILGTLFAGLFKLMCCCCKKSKEQEEQHEKDMLKAEGLNIDSQDIFTDFRIGPLQDKYLKSTKELKNINKLKQTNPDFFDGIYRETMHNMEKH